eukprot:11219584-Lingulodinium_polyedra.AAC.3
MAPNWPSGGGLVRGGVLPSVEWVNARDKRSLGDVSTRGNYYSALHTQELQTQCGSIAKVGQNPWLLLPQLLQWGDETYSHDAVGRGAFVNRLPLKELARRTYLSSWEAGDA